MNSSTFCLISNVLRVPVSEHYRKMDTYIYYLLQIPFLNMKIKNKTVQSIHKMKIAINKGLSGELLFQKSSKRCAVSKSTLCCTVKIIKQNDEVNLCSKSRCKKTFDEFYELLLKEYVVNLSNRCMPLTKKNFSSLHLI